MFTELGYLLIESKSKISACWIFFRKLIDDFYLYQWLSITTNRNINELKIIGRQIENYSINSIRFMSLSLVQIRNGRLIPQN